MIHLSTEAVLTELVSGVATLEIASHLAQVVEADPAKNTYQVRLQNSEHRYYCFGEEVSNAEISYSRMLKVVCML